MVAQWLIVPETKRTVSCIAMIRENPGQGAAAPHQRSLVPRCIAEGASGMARVLGSTVAGSRPFRSLPVFSVQGTGAQTRGVI